MKLKQDPADFTVEELTAARPEPRGPFAFYRMQKIGWTTPDALQIVCRRWDLAWNRLAYGGLKDRHAETIQYLTIDGGPERDLEHERLYLRYLGRRTEPYTSRSIAANRFGIVLRSLAPDEAKAIIAKCEHVAEFGAPNYFDDQRFGSVTADCRFIGRELVFGRFEEALKLALVEPYAFDRAESKAEKAILRAHWGDWPACKAKLPKGHARSLVTYLCDHPTKFKGAIERLRPELQGLYLSAFQSELWNRILDRWLKAELPPEQLGAVTLWRGDLAAPQSARPEWLERWRTLEIPLPSPRIRDEEHAEILPLIDAVLAEENLTRKQLKVPGLDRPFFSKGIRPACLQPQHLAAERQPDDKHRGRDRVNLNFDLIRGAYATMVVKCLTGQRDAE